MALNQQAQIALEQAKKLADDANALKSKSLADAKAVVATATAAAKASAPTPPVATTAAAKATPAKMKEEKTSTGKYVYSVFHTVMSIIAIFLSYRCNGCFQWIPFLAALCCPYVYIIYIIIFKSQCLSTSFIEPNCGPDVVYVQAPQYPPYGYTAPPSYGYNTPPSFNYPPPAPMPPTI